MTPYVSRYRRNWVFALVRAWSCVERKGQEIHCLLFLWERLRNNPSQGIPGPFSFKRLQIWITDALVERLRSSLIGAHHESKSLSPFQNKKPRHWRAPGLLHSGKLMTSVLTRPRPA